MLRMRKPGTAPSVEIRMLVNDSIVFQSEAEMMYYAAKYCGKPEGEWWDVLSIDGIAEAVIREPAKVRLEFKAIRVEMDERVLRFWLYFVLYFVAGMVSGGALMWAVTP